MKNLILSLALVLTLFLTLPGNVYADEREVCTTSYGQGVVCGKKSFEEPEEIVAAGLAEDLRLIGLALLASAPLIYFKNKKDHRSFEVNR